MARLLAFLAKSVEGSCFVRLKTPLEETWGHTGVTKQFRGVLYPRIQSIFQVFGVVEVADPITWVIVWDHLPSLPRLK